MGAIRALRKLQIGIEGAGTPGTPVAAGVRILGDVTYRDASEAIEAERDYGVYARYGEAFQLASYLTEVDIETDLSYEQILYPLLAGLKGAVVGVEEVGAEGNWEYVFQAPVTGDPAPNTYTMEYWEDDEDGSDPLTLEADYGICKSMGISASKGPELAVLRHSWAAREATVTTPTAALGIPTRTLVPSQQWSVKFAATMAGLPGASVISGEILSFDWDMAWFDIKRRLSGSLDFDGYRIGTRETDLKITMDLTSTSEGERVNMFRAGAVRFIRLQAVGAAIGSTTYRITIDGAYTMPGPFDPSGDDDGLTTVDLDYKGLYDSTAGYDLKIEVVNNLGANPPQ
ncbi:hypothetical protein LCGC14_2726580 [marine sediment metagenome]|uniref:Uncharacterized protein n=1 Tax=marine sediment metagenome TaxID=412755 RepID=A0A0F8Z8M7_9ZZZZ